MAYRDGFEVNIMRTMAENTMEKTVGMVLGRETLLQGKMVQLTNILVGMDFSPASQRALDCALALARRYEARMFVAHVVTSEPNVMLAPELMALGNERAIRDAPPSLYNDCYVACRTPNGNVLMTVRLSLPLWNERYAAPPAPEERVQQTFCGT